jgi:hypothetical protein
VDQYIRIGLVAVWALFGVALLVWWRRRRASKRYAYSERAQTILDAIRLGRPVGMIYWSKTEKRFLRRVVTPRELDGYSMRGWDHKLGTERIFKVTRIRWAEVIPAGAPEKPPSRFKVISRATVVATALGGIALALLAVALLRSKPVTPVTVILPPLETPAAAPAVATAAPVTNQTAAPNVFTLPAGRGGGDAEDFLTAAPSPVVEKVTSSLVVENHPRYKPGQVSTVLRSVLRYRPERALELEQSVATLGQAAVWFGPAERGERLQRLLENLDLQVRLEVEEAGRAPTNAPAAPGQPRGD